MKPLWMEIMCQYYWKSFSHGECVICNIHVLFLVPVVFECWKFHTSFFTVPIRPECCCFMNIVYGEVQTWRWEDADIWGLLSSCRKPQKGSDALSVVTRVIHKNLHRFVITEKSENGNGGKKISAGKMSWYIIRMWTLTKLIIYSFTLSTKSCKWNRCVL